MAIARSVAILGDDLGACKSAKSYLMKETQEQILQTLEEEHTKKVNSLFVMCLEILFIFGIPAFGVLLVYKLVHTDALTLQIGLPAAFFLSWTVFLFRWKKLSNEIIKLESNLKVAKRNVEEEKLKNNSVTEIEKSQIESEDRQDVTLEDKNV